MRGHADELPTQTHELTLGSPQLVVACPGFAVTAAGPLSLWQGKRQKRGGRLKWITCPRWFTMTPRKRQLLGPSLAQAPLEGLGEGC